ncbi:hypothetical protein [Zophobihabitans entericus]|uniref:DUF3899 domain-containing protein n=1 Tax=Zophobihabitans entericus TaxID=1635327 RepID=A0A6G9IC03_9GAMM|nr:hypothetical protein [Zophobihabitans entericus]QIQ21761.1 hypothetical protein IPMB12_08745 [Zophobihabitans entericus]
MFISWSGRGLVIPLVVVVSAMVLIPFFSSDTSLMWIAASFLLSGIIIYFLGKKWNTHKELIPQEDSMVQTKPQYRLTPHNKHRFYWIPMQYFGIVLMVLSVVTAIMYLVKS